MATYCGSSSTRIFIHWCINGSRSGRSSNVLPFSKHTTLYQPYHNTHIFPFSTDNNEPTEYSPIRQPPINPNHKLESIKEQGLTILESIASDIQSKTNDRLLLEDQDTGPSISQLREARRLHSLVEDAIQQYSSKNVTFCIRGEPIAVIDVEISPDIREAIVHWSLPYGLLMSEKIPDAVMENLTNIMQEQLNQKGGYLQKIVHHQLRRYYRPPKLRFQPARANMLRKVLREMTF